MQARFIIFLIILVATPFMYSAASCNVDNCYSCQTNNSNYCAQCNSGFYESNGRCQLNGTVACNVRNCLVCDPITTGACKICVSLYKLNAVKTCTPLSCEDSNCENCPNDRNVCERCKLNYFVTMGYCQAKCDSSRCARCQYDVIATENRCAECNSSAYTLQCKYKYLKYS
jgi:hypothetical protein